MNLRYQHLINVQVALRWRTEKEVVTGKGQFSCGDKKCSLSEELKTWEVNFAYYENKEKKNALVKLSMYSDIYITGLKSC